MSDSKVVLPEKGSPKPRGRDAGQPRIWALLGWTGLAFLVVGGMDFALTWYPTAFGNREWEFGTITASFNGLPIVVLGLALLVGASAMTGRRWLALLAAVGSFGLLLWVLAAAILYATNVPLALANVPIEVATGLKKAVVKTAGQSVVYPVILTFLGVRSVQAFRGSFGSRG